MGETQSGLRGERGLQGERGEIDNSVNLFPVINFKDIKDSCYIHNNWQCKGDDLMVRQLNHEPLCCPKNDVISALDNDTVVVTPQVLGHAISN